MRHLIELNGIIAIVDYSETYQLPEDKAERLLMLTNKSHSGLTEDEKLEWEKMMEAECLCTIRIDAIQFIDTIKSIDEKVGFYLTARQLSMLNRGIDSLRKATEAKGATCKYVETL